MPICDSEKILQGRCLRILIAHLHPIGKLEYSNADKELTHKLALAGNHLEIHVMNHLIINVSGEGRYLLGEKMAPPPTALKRKR